jgi:hypothetical protein
VDDTEFQVDDVRSSHPHLSVPSTKRSQPFPPSTLLSGRWRLGLTAGSLALAVVVILSAWLPLHNQPHVTTRISSPTAQNTATPVLVPVGAPTPRPITSTLATPPPTCPGVSSPLTTIKAPAFGDLSGSTVQLSGRAPVWIPVDYLPQSITGIPEQSPPSTTTPAWWPSIFILWEIGPTSHPTVTVQVRDLHSGAPAWWTEGGSSPQVPTLVLSPPPDQPTPTVYSSYQTELFITQASCYQMRVTWPGGNWMLIFAAGWGPYY